MSPDHKGPIWRPRGHQDLDRDRYVEKHPTPLSGVPDFADEEGTGKHDGEELDAIRANRPPPKRFEKLEKRQDKFEIRLEKLDTKVDTLLDLATKAEAERMRRSEQDAKERELRRKHVIAIITAIGIALATILAVFK
jgi:hypothetical protein